MGSQKKSLSIPEIMSALTLDEKISLISGKQSIVINSNSGLEIQQTTQTRLLLERLIGGDDRHTTAIQRGDIDISSLRFSDGLNGVKGINPQTKYASSCFPCGSALASTWNTKLVEAVATSIGEDCHKKGIHVLQGPSGTVLRSPLFGTAFNTFGEDPVLVGKMCAAFVKGVQSKGVACAIKGFVANNANTQEHYASSNLSDSVLREVYLKPFQIAIAESDPKIIVTGPNRVNGTHISDDYALIQETLREDLGFKGLVVSSPEGIYSTVLPILAGLDLEMPGPSVVRGKAIKRAILGGLLNESHIDARVEKVLELVEWCQKSRIAESSLVNSKSFHLPAEAWNLDPLSASKTGLGGATKELNQKLLHDSAVESIVLLKNYQNLLPLSTHIPIRIAIIGPSVIKIPIAANGPSVVQPTSLPSQSFLKLVREVIHENSVLKYHVGTRITEALSQQAFEKRLCSPTWSKGEGCLEVRFYNNDPWISTQNPSSESSASPILNIFSPVVYTTTIDTTTIIFNPPPSKSINETCWISFKGFFTPIESETLLFGLAVAGQADLYIDGKLILENSENQIRGPWLGFTTSKERQVEFEVVEGQRYEIEVRFSNSRFIRRSVQSDARWPGIGGIRLTCKSHLNPALAVDEAGFFAKQADVVILLVGATPESEKEGVDRPNLKLSKQTNDLAQAVVSQNPSTILINISGAPIDLPFLPQCRSFLHVPYGGDFSATALVKILFGGVSPSGKLPFTWPKKLEDSPSYLNFLPDPNNGNISYGESHFVGYKGFEILDREPLFGFGEGGSYIGVELGGKKDWINEGFNENCWFLDLRIKNCSTVFDGATVVQVYASSTPLPPNPSLINTSVSSQLEQLSIEPTPPQARRPLKHLVAFEKVFLKMGQIQSIEIPVSYKDFGKWNEIDQEWNVEAGDYEIFVGFSSREIILKGVLNVKKKVCWS